MLLSYWLWVRRVLGEPTSPIYPHNQKGPADITVYCLQIAVIIRRSYRWKRWHKWLFFSTNFQFFLYLTVSFYKENFKDLHKWPLAEFRILSTFHKCMAFQDPLLVSYPFLPLTGRRLKAQKIAKIGYVPEKCQNCVKNVGFLTKVCLSLKAGKMVISSPQPLFWCHLQGKIKTLSSVALFSHFSKKKKKFSCILTNFWVPSRGIHKPWVPLQSPWC